MSTNQSFRNCSLFLGYWYSLSNTLNPSHAGFASHLNLMLITYLATYATKQDLNA